MVHKDKAYPGQHEAIVDEALWDEVQATLAANTNGERREGTRLATLLAGPDVASMKRSRQDAQPAKHPIILDIPIALKRAGTGMKLVVPGARNNAKCAPGLIRLLLRAFAIQDRLEQNPDLTLQRIAEVEGVSPSYVTRLLRLSYLAPDIVTAIVDGQQPPELTAEKLMRNTRLPLSWEAQRKRLGFAHA